MTMDEFDTEEGRGWCSVMSAPQEKKRKTGGGMGKVQRKRGAEENIDVPTLGQVAEEGRFEPLRELLEPVKDTPVTELKATSKDALKELAGEQHKLVMTFFLAACDARVSEADRKRAHMASEESSLGKQQRWLFFLSLSLSLAFASLCSPGSSSLLV